MARDVEADIQRIRAASDKRMRVYRQRLDAVRQRLKEGRNIFRRKSMGGSGG